MDVNMKTNTSSFSDSWIENKATHHVATEILGGILMAKNLKNLKVWRAHAIFSFDTTKEAMLKIQNISHGFSWGMWGKQKNTRN